MSIGRRQLLLCSVSAIALTVGQPAFALIPVIIATLAAITVLAAATGKAAAALEIAVRNGQRLWNVVTSVPDINDAKRELQEKQEYLRKEMRIRREVIKHAEIGQSGIGNVVTDIRFYLATRNTNAWNNVLPDIKDATTALESMAEIFRIQAVWFPAESQTALAQLPNLYESRLKIISNLQILAQEAPPTTDEEFAAWTSLVNAYDDLRVESLRLIRALDTYTS